MKSDKVVEKDLRDGSIIIADTPEEALEMMKKAGLSKDAQELLTELVSENAGDGLKECENCGVCDEMANDYLTIVEGDINRLGNEAGLKVVIKIEAQLIIGMLKDLYHSITVKSREKGVRKPMPNMTEDEVDNAFIRNLTRIYNKQLEADNIPIRIQFLEE